MPILFVEREREEQEDNIAQNNDNPVKAGQNAIPDEDLPNLVVFLKIEIEGLIILPIPQVMSQMALADQMERRWEKQRHHAPSEIIPRPVVEQHRMFGFVDDRINGIHHRAKSNRQQAQAPPATNVCRTKEASAYRRELQTDDQ
jgi:hypothetical protein